MKRKIVSLFVLLILGLAAYANAAAELRILPHSWNIKGKGKGRVKAEILNVDGKTFEASNIRMNGIEPLKVKASAHKVKAFFRKSEVVATLGEVQAGQFVNISVTFGAGENAATLSDQVQIVSKKKKNGNSNNGNGD